MELRIRVARPTDLAGVDELLSRAYPRLLKADYPPSILVTALPLISRAQPALLASGTYFVAEADGQIVGAGGWSRDRGTRHLGHIRHVVSDDRFQRAGIGRAVVASAINDAQRADIREMECWSTRTAVPFYSALGFHEAGPIDVQLQPGISFPSVRMLRALT